MSDTVRRKWATLVVDEGDHTVGDDDSGVDQFYFLLVFFMKIFITYNVFEFIFPINFIRLIIRLIHFIFTIFKLLFGLVLGILSYYWKS